MSEKPKGVNYISDATFTNTVVTLNTAIILEIHFELSIVMEQL